MAEKNKFLIHPRDQPVFDWLYIIFSLWFLTGIYYDAWSHTHHPELESFFTTPHFVMYTGAAALSILVIYICALNYFATNSFASAIPDGYMPAVFGVIIFMVGGVGDLFWDELFGVEQGLEASFSPTHLLLMAAIILLLGSPVYSSWLRREPNTNISNRITRVLSFSFLLAGLTVITLWAHPVVIQYPIEHAGQNLEEVGMLSFILQTFLLMGLVLFSVRDDLLPMGGYTFALTIHFFSALSHAR